MKKMIRLIFVATSLIYNVGVSYAGDFYDYKIHDHQGDLINLSQFKGKPVLIVNIATRCGYTGQLDGLEKIHKKYSTKGLRVIGIPSNDFMGQSPESNEKIAEFCKAKYGTSFPITEKIVVKGKKKHPLISHIINESMLLEEFKKSNEIGWNFEKFLIDKSGKVVGRFTSGVKPDDKKLAQRIESIL